MLYGILVVLPCAQKVSVDTLGCLLTCLTQPSPCLEAILLYLLNNAVDLGGHRNPKAEIGLLEVGELLLVAILQILVLVPDPSVSLSKHSCVKSALLV